MSEARLRLLASEGALWALLDACDAPGVPPRVRLLGPGNGDCLWKGEAREKYWAVAPWVARVDLALLDWIRTSLWDRPWGLFAETREALDVLRRHFRSLLVVEVPDGRKVCFRYYDPRVFRAFIGTVSSAERAEFFGPVATYWGVFGEPGARTVVGFRKDGRPC